VVDSKWETLWSLFDRALKRPVGERSAWLKSHCPDPALRRELTALLRAHERKDSLLDGDRFSVVDDALEPGDRVGAWRVERLLGLGGMGAVYLVERADGAFERRAALKLLHGGVGGPDARARFERERRILASLNHPHIARLLDAGITNRGRPWLLMEAVDGPTLSEWLERHTLSMGERLGLFEQVCHAIAHAHRRLVVHRDLKASNIRIDASGRPRVLDFGIAKLLDAAAAASVTRRADSVPLTPAYTSPEQVRGEVAAIGMDVYALGALLHEVLTGQPPFGHGGGRSDWLEHRRRFEPRVSVDKEIPAELDWVLARALAFEPEDRYASADELAADIRRIREHRSPRARAVGPLYRARKFARRNWRALAFASVVVALVVGLGAELYRSAERARAAQAESEAARSQAESLSTFLKDLFARADPTRQGGRQLTAQELLDAGRQRLANQPGLPASSRVAFWLALADVYLNLGDHGTSRQLATQAAELARRTGSEDLADALVRLGRARHAAGEYQAALAVFQRASESVPAEDDPARFDLVIGRGMALQRLGRLEDAGEAFRRAEAWLAQHAPESVDRRAEVALRLGSWHWGRGRLGTAERFYADALAARREQVPAAWPEVATAMMAHASAKFALGRFDAAREGFAEALAVRRRVLGDDHPDTAVSLNYLGASLYELGRYAEAQAPLSEAVAIQRRVLPDDSPARAGALNNLGLVQWQLGRLGDATATFEKALAINRASLGADHPDLANNLNNLGLIALEQARFEQALALFDRAVALVAAARGDSHPDLGTPLTNRARALLVLERHAEADASLTRAHKILSGVREDHPRLVDTLLWWSLADCLGGADERARARLDRAAVIDQASADGDGENPARIGAVRAACAGRPAAQFLPPDSPPDLQRLLSRLNEIHIADAGRH
jgi:serine/threonine-protein kinase